MGISGTGNDGRRQQSMKGRKLWVPQMSYGGSLLFAASIRSVGVDAAICPDSDALTLEYGGRYTSGEECLPARITLGNFLKVIAHSDFNPAKTAFFMPTAEGPCRFGQYAPYIRKVLRDIGLEEVLVFSPTSRNGYEGLGDQVNELMQTSLRGLLAADVLRKMLHKTRPYEINPGDTWAVYTRALSSAEKVLEQEGVPGDRRLNQLLTALTGSRDEFRAIPAKYDRTRPFIGVVGEIFCRLTPFTNDFVVRKIEEFGGECSLAHVAEWLWYTNIEQQKRLKQAGQIISKAMLGAKIKEHIQHKEEHRLIRIFEEDLHGYDEPSVRKIFQYSQPYLPSQGCLGEMVLSIGKSVFHYHQGCDGVVDISPFTCMNGIVTEALYPRLSSNHDDIPIRNFFFDGTQTDLDRDVGIFMELARTYQARKKVQRVFPSHFEPN